MREKVTNGGVKVNSSITKIELPPRVSFDLTLLEIVNTPKHHI